MADMMTFPDTVEEFMEEYKLVDTEQVYTNGTELVPIFRMKQWFEHEKEQLSQEGTTSDTISRQAAIDGKISIQRANGVEIYSDEAVPVEYLKNLPSRQPEPSTSCSEFPNNSDTVSRQAAIDALKNRWKKTRNYEGNGDDIAEECELYLKQVPSAQPESCEGCKWENAFGYGECSRCRRRLEDMYERGTCENG